MVDLIYELTVLSPLFKEQRWHYLLPDLQGGLGGYVSFQVFLDLVIGGSLGTVLHPVPFTIKLHLVIICYTSISLNTDY